METSPKKHVVNADIIKTLPRHKDIESEHQK